MEDCKGPRSAIKEIKGRAREEGINLVAFNELLAQHRTARAEQKRLAQMEPDDRRCLQPARAGARRVRRYAAREPLR